VKHLLDVNVLLAAIWANHPQHGPATVWLEGKAIVLCPLSELGFVRISTNPKAINSPMAKARAGLEKFAQERKADRIADDLPALDSHSSKSEHVTDFYLASLAARHGLKLATFDASINHPAVEVIAATASPGT
jgi:toxin-antitoxin system PIN domain toxin